MSDDRYRGRGNGEDMAERPRRVPLHVATPGRDDAPWQVAQKATDAIVALVPRVNELSEVAERVEIAVLAMPTTIRAIVREELVGRPRLPTLSEYNPDLTPAGGIRVSPEAWEAVQRRIHEQDEDRKLADAHAAGARQALAELAAQNDRFRKRITFVIAVGSPTLAALAWLATHLFHL
jgi:hypothetical protein